MGLRFRKSFKLAPGIRINVGSGGTSWTLGARGASVNISKRGTHLNLGLPGTGITHRTRLDGNSIKNSPAPVQKARPQPQTIEMQITVEVTDDGRLIFKDQDGNAVTSAVEKATRVQQADTIHKLISGKCERINIQLAELREIHHHTPRPNAKPQYLRIPFEEPAPALPVKKEYGLLAKISKRMAGKIDVENNLQLTTYEKKLAIYTSRKQTHDQSQTSLKQQYFSAMAGDSKAMEELLEHQLAQIAWPRETIVSLEVSPAGDRVFLDVDLPEIQDMPESTASIAPGILELKMNLMSQAEIRALYAEHVHAIGFRILGEVFSLLPTVCETVLSGYSQRLNLGTGIVMNDYLLSVRASREEWNGVNFDGLSEVDAVAAFSNFTLRRSYKSGIFGTIVPYGLELQLPSAGQAVGAAEESTR